MCLQGRWNEPELYGDHMQTFVLRRYRLCAKIAIIFSIVYVTPSLNNSMNNLPRIMLYVWSVFGCVGGDLSEAGMENRHPLMHQAETQVRSRRRNEKPAELRDIISRMAVNDSMSFRKMDGRDNYREKNAENFARKETEAMRRRIGMQGEEWCKEETTYWQDFQRRRKQEELEKLKAAETSSNSSNSSTPSTSSTPSLPDEFSNKSYFWIPTPVDENQKSNENSNSDTDSNNSGGISMSDSDGGESDSGDESEIDEEAIQDEMNELLASALFADGVNANKKMKAVVGPFKHLYVRLNGVTYNGVVVRYLMGSEYIRFKISDTERIQIPFDTIKCMYIQGGKGNVVDLTTNVTNAISGSRLVKKVDCIKMNGDVFVCVGCCCFTFYLFAVKYQPVSTKSNKTKSFPLTIFFDYSSSSSSSSTTTSRTTTSTNTSSSSSSSTSSSNSSSRSSVVSRNMAPPPPSSSLPPPPLSTTALPPPPPSSSSSSSSSSKNYSTKSQTQPNPKKKRKITKSFKKKDSEDQLKEQLDVKQENLNQKKRKADKKIVPAPSAKKAKKSKPIKPPPPPPLKNCKLTILLHVGVSMEIKTNKSFTNNKGIVKSKTIWTLSTADTQRWQRVTLEARPNRGAADKVEEAAMLISKRAHKSKMTIQLLRRAAPGGPVPLDLDIVKERRDAISREFRGCRLLQAMKADVANTNKERILKIRAELDHVDDMVFDCAHNGINLYQNSTPVCYCPFCSCKIELLACKKDRKYAGNLPWPMFCKITKNEEPEMHVSCDTPTLADGIKSLKTQLPPETTKLLEEENLEVEDE